MTEFDDGSLTVQINRVPRTKRRVEKVVLSVGPFAASTTVGELIDKTLLDLLQEFDVTAVIKAPKKHEGSDDAEDAAASGGDGNVGAPINLDDGQQPTQPPARAAKLRLKGSSTALDPALTVAAAGILREGTEAWLELVDRAEFVLDAAAGAKRRAAEEDAMLQQAMRESVKDAFAHNLAEPQASTTTSGKNPSPPAPSEAPAFETSRLTDVAAPVAAAGSNNSKKNTEKACPMCTFLNPAKAKKCDMCETPF
jgi:hypothetical protein